MKWAKLILPPINLFSFPCQGELKRQMNELAYEQLHMRMAESILVDRLDRIRAAVDEIDKKIAELNYLYYLRCGRFDDSK